MNNINESLLNSWLRLSTAINNPRLVSELTYNESLICNILYQQCHDHPEQPLTATKLCQMTNMLKSQMNRTLNQLEVKNMITKERSSVDKRQIFITMNMEQCHTYERQHAQILQILDAVIHHLGMDKTQAAITLFNDISMIAEKLDLGK
ncbi:MAG: MarR family transcriptional regulator [Lachnospiraceae bacterium]|nr:MarR family transcriptional regulator [Lachnospiraceae bacterium]